MSKRKTIRKVQPKPQMFGMNLEDVDRGNQLQTRLSEKHIRQWMKDMKQMKRQIGTTGGAEPSTNVSPEILTSQTTNRDIQQIMKIQDELGKKATMYMEKTREQREAFFAFIKKYAPIISVVVLTIIVLVVYFTVFHNRVETYLNRMRVYNSSETKSVFDNPDYLNQGFRLCDFYVASAYRAYLPCTNKFDYSSEQAVEKCIIYGARYIHLDIFPETFSFASKPVCCAGEEVGNWNYTTRIPLENVFSVINTYAFTNLRNPKSTNADPFFIHLTFKCWGQVYVINKVADMIYESFADNLLDSKFGYCGTKTNENIALEPIENLYKKIVIICDAEDKDDILNSDIYELTNLCPKIGVNCRYMTYEQVRNSTSLDEIVEYNKKNFTVVRPSFTMRDKYNYNFYTPYYLGCQFISMNFTEPDAYMQSYTNRFAEYSMILKPYKLRYKPVLIPEPKPADKANTFEADVFVPSTGDAIYI
jgi:hypothetical protein